MRYNMRKRTTSISFIRKFMHKPPRLTQLYKLLDMINAAKLGNDWESRKELEAIRSSAIQEIKKIEQEIYKRPSV